MIKSSKKGASVMPKLTPMRAIRQKCLECAAGSTKEVRMCPIKKCALYVYRNGHRPKGEEDTAEDVPEEKSADTAEVF